MIWLSQFLQFISLINRPPTVATLRRFYIEPYKTRHPPQAFIRLLCLQKLKRYKYLTERYRELDDQTAKTTRLQVQTQLQNTLALAQQTHRPRRTTNHTHKNHENHQPNPHCTGIQIGKIASADATHIAARPNDKEAAYNDHYKMKCYLLHHLNCAATGLTLNWIVNPGNVDEGQFTIPMLAKTLADGFKPDLLAVDNGYAHYFNYETPNFLGIKLLIGFRRKKSLIGEVDPKPSSYAFGKWLRLAS